MDKTSGAYGFAGVVAHRVRLSRQAVSRHRIDWLASLDDASVDLVFADPPYNEGRLR